MSMDTEFLNISSIKRFGLDRILVNNVCFLLEGLKHLDQNYPRHLVARQSVQLVGVTPRAKKTFQTMLTGGGGSDFGKDTIASGVSAKSISGSSQCLGPNSATLEPASSRSCT